MHDDKRTRFAALRSIDDPGIFLPCFEKRKSHTFTALSMAYLDASVSVVNRSLFFHLRISRRALVS